MKIKEFLISNLLSNHNILRYESFHKWAKELNDPKIVFIEIDTQKGIDIEHILQQHQHKIIINVAVDFDFPPPKLPFSFHNFRDKEEYNNINYYDKLNKNVVDILEKNNLTVYSFSVSVNNPRIHFIPISVYWGFNHFYFQGKQKTNLCYANFALGIERNCWFGYPRKEVYNIIKNKDFILCENIFTFNPIRKTDNLDHFYNMIAQSKFAICPRGVGIDTYRLWDCVVLGCIPIVERYESHEQFKDFPILFIDKISDLNNISREYLEDKYREFQERDFNYEKILLSYWQDRILKSI
jgi:hypothetical protein